MAESDYWNFDLTISPRTDGGAGYSISADGKGGQGKANVEWPFTATEIAELRALVEGPARDARRPGQMIGGSKPDYRSKVRLFGERLFDAVFVGNVRSVFESSVNAVQADSNRPSGLRIRLRLQDAPEVAEVPWEYLYNRTASRHLSIFKETPVVRFMEIPQRVLSVTTPLPIRVLVMMANPSGLTGLDSETEARNIQNAFADLKAENLAEVDIIEKGTLDELAEHLDEPNVYHIFHYIGHGGLVAGATPGEDEGVLYFEDDAGGREEIGGDLLLSQLLRCDKLRLAVLNSCDGAEAGTRDPFAGMAQQLVRGGIPAAVAMQFRITDKAAVLFASTFYERLARGYAVDRALTDTRNKLFTSSPTEWGTPVLFMRADDGRIFDLPTKEQLRQQRIEALAADAKAAIDRKDYAGAILKLQEIQNVP